MTFSSIWLNSHDCRREGKFSNYASSSISSQGRLLIMIPHLIGGYHPILTDSRTLYNSPLYMPKLTTSNILFFHHLLKPGTPYTLMLPARILCCPLNVPYITSCICGFRVVVVWSCCKVARLTLAFIYIAISIDLC